LVLTTRLGITAAPSLTNEEQTVNQLSIADIVGLCILLASLLFSAEVAAVVGPYMVIILGSAIGASFALTRRERSPRLSAFWFFFRIAGMAVLLTAFLAAIVHSLRPDLNERVLLAPIAILIGLIGDGWPAVARKLMSMFWSVLDAMRGGKGGTP
jgi:hypothetical protein